MLSLQTDLDNSVAVQNDFVRLSQSLQVELEKIRQAESEVSPRNVITMVIIIMMILITVVMMIMIRW